MITENDMFAPPPVSAEMFKQHMQQARPLHMQLDSDVKGANDRLSELVNQDSGPRYGDLSLYEFVERCRKTDCNTCPLMIRNGRYRGHCWMNHRKPSAWKVAMFLEHRVKEKV